MGNGMIAQTKTNCFWFHLGPTLLSAGVSDQTTAGAETVQMEDGKKKKKKDLLQTFCTCVSGDAVFKWDIQKCVCVCVCVYGGQPG